MKNLHFLAAMAVLLGTTACPTIDPFDDLGTDSFTTIDTANDEVDTSSTESGTTDATSESTSDTTTDTTDGACGSFGCACTDSSTCDVGLECNGGICGQPMGDTTDTTDTTTGGGGDTWDPMMCMPPAEVLGVGMLEGNFCSNPCTTDADCAPAPAGTQAGCVLTLMDGDPPSFCALICSLAADSCPAGSTCKAAGQMDPDVGLCTYP